MPLGAARGVGRGRMMKQTPVRLKCLKRRRAYRKLGRSDGEEERPSASGQSFEKLMKVDANALF